MAVSLNQVLIQWFLDDSLPVFLGWVPISLICEGADGSYETVMCGIAATVENFVRHERETSETSGERFTDDFSIGRLPPSFIEPFPLYFVVLRGFHSHRADAVGVYVFLGRQHLNPN